MNQLRHVTVYTGPVDPATAVQVRVIRTPEQLQEIARANRQNLKTLDTLTDWANRTGEWAEQ